MACLRQPWHPAGAIGVECQAPPIFGRGLTRVKVNFRTGEQRETWFSRALGEGFGKRVPVSQMPGLRAFSCGRVHH
ncbi:hypothetical protein DYH55_12480 [Methylovirgula sp. 4M-Z18]|nr:hypothetical protein DYH55_12480 [Methylovirgula sp. 4M-Z18]